MSLTVCAVMLVNGRERMVKRAVESYRAQSYEHKSMVGLDTGEPSVVPVGIIHSRMPTWSGRSIGWLRNRLNGATGHADIIAHWDSDEWSNPNRLTEQIALLDATGADVVGYNVMPFWDTSKCDKCQFGSPFVPCDAPGSWHGTGLGPCLCRSEAWLYSCPNSVYALGTSLCYRRRIWQRMPFADKSSGEDTDWLRDVRAAGWKVVGVSALVDDEPRMIASIHGGNISSKIQPGREEWYRAPQWDSYCRERMAL